MITIAAIVEGHGEVAALPILLRRIGLELLNNTHIEALRPIRQPRGQLTKHDHICLSKAIQLASLKLDETVEVSNVRSILLMVDADDDCPAQMARELGTRCSDLCIRHNCGIVFPNVEFETWFVAAAESLEQYLELPNQIPTAPEASRAGKGWIAERFKEGKYSEAVDQARLASQMDLNSCRGRSPSFDKLCRELELLSARDL